MIHISNSAQAHFAKLLKSQQKGTQIRLFVIRPGTTNAECGIAYCPPDSVKESDISFKFGNIIAYVDKYSAPYLEDAEIDFVVDQFSSQLIFQAPNAKIQKVSDKSSLEDRIRFLLASKINPQLESHRGFVSLVKVTKAGCAILNFGGGCNGCSMVDFTLKEVIKKQLLSSFPELKDVYDFTKHQRDKNSYY